MPADPAVPDALEVRFAYATAVVASFAWVAATMPGVHLAQAGLSEDLATPMHRGAPLVVPALLLLVGMPVATVLARDPLGLRGLLSWASAFVAGYAAAAFATCRPRSFGWAVVGALGLLAVVSVRDALRAGRAASASPPRELPPRTADLRLALALLALLTPAGVLAAGGEERASWIVPFLFLALAAAGERRARGLLGLRRAATAALVLVAAHLVVALRYALEDGGPAPAGWTPWGAAALVLSGLVLVLAVAWTAVLLVRGRGARPAEAAS